MLDVVVYLFAKREDETFLDIHKYKQLQIHQESIKVLISIIILLLLFKDIIVKVLGVESVEFTPVYYVLTPIILFGSLNYLLGIVGLLNLDKEKWFQNATLAGSIVNLLLCLTLSVTYGAFGSAVALTLAEFSVLIIVIMYLYKLSKFTK